MFFMAEWRSGWQHRLVTTGLLLVLALGAACGRSGSFQRTEVATPATEQNLPFHASGDQASATEASTPSLAPDTKAGSVPFHGLRPRVLPAGTLLTVQLEDAISSTKVRAGDVFAAALAAPLILDGDSLIARGTAAKGYVQSELAQTNSHGSASGYFRLSLSAITLDGRQVAIETSSLYARGVVQRSKTIGVPKGRHLTFRLTAPVTLEDRRALASR